MPIARITWDGSSEPEVQAEPLDAAMPSLLSSSRIASPSMYSKAMLAVFGRRLSTSPVAKALGTCARIPSCNWSRMRLTVVFSNAMCSSASSAATPSPTIAGTFSVPARRPRSW